MEKNGFAVRVNTTDSMAEIKTGYQIPVELQSCHTAIVDGYIIEGHVPAAEIEKLLLERPEIIGIAVAGMPPGSPGMDIDGFENDPYDVIAFDAQGNQEIFSRYPK